MGIGELVFKHFNNLLTYISLTRIFGIQCLPDFLIMNKKYLIGMLIIIITGSGYVKIWIVSDECCVEYPNNVCEYHYDDGSFACAFDGKPVY